MKYMKGLGFVTAITATALLALFGAGSASATIVEDSIGQLKSNTSIDMSDTGAGVILRVGSTVLDECTGSTIEAITAGDGGVAQTVPASVAGNDVLWNLCTRTTKTLAGGNLEIHWTSGSNGVVTATGFEVTVATIFGSCVYGFGAIPKNFGEIQGGAPGILSINVAIPEISGPCPGSEARLTASFTVTNPEPLRVTSS